MITILEITVYKKELCAPFCILLFLIKQIKQKFRNLTTAELKVRHEGFEPSTLRLKGVCSTD